MGLKKSTGSVLLALVCLVVVIVAGCGLGANGGADVEKGANGEEVVPVTEKVVPVTIEYWHINSAIFGGEAVDELIERFQEIHPHITVLSRFQEGSYGGLLKNLQAAIAAGNPPAVAQIGYNFRLLALYELPHKPIFEFAQTDAGHQLFLDKFVDGVLGLGQDGEGNQRGIPYVSSLPVLYYNADLFRAAGLNPDNPPETWEEVREFALAIKEHTEEYGIGIRISTSNNWLPQSLIESNGGRFLSDDDMSVVVYSPENIKAYEFWQALAVKDKTLPVVTNKELEHAFLAGRLGMYFSTSGGIASFAEQVDFDFRIAEFASWNGEQRRLATGGNALFIFANEQAEQIAAYEFIKFLSSKEGQTMWVEGTGYLPIIKGVADNPKYLADFFAANPLIAPVKEQLPYAVPWMIFPGPRAFEAEQVLIEAREAILNGAPVAETLKKADERINEILN